MEIISNHKSTEFGSIPEDWDYKLFGDVITLFSSGATPYRGKPKYYNGNIRWITSGELNYNTINDTIEKISKEAVSDTNLKIHPSGTFLIAITGLEAAGTRGRCGFVGKPSTTNQSCMALYVNPTILDSRFLYHFYIWQGQNLAFKYCQGTKQQSYTAGIAKKLPIIIPPLPEQKAISEVLSDTDTLIQSLEKQIEKKLLIKHGAMQKLLSPKNSWKSALLKDVVQNFSTGKLDANAMKSDGIYRFYTCAKDFYYINTFAFDDEALLISGNGANVGYIHHYKGKFNAYQRTYVLTGFNINVHFLKLLLDVILQARIDAEVYAGNTPYIRMSTLTDMIIKYPEENKEQSQIAEAIGDMEFEIKLLIKKVSKYKSLKQGLMQSLLLGKIRLNIP